MKYNLAAEPCTIGFQIPDYTSQVNAIGTENFRCSRLLNLKKTKFYQASSSGCLEKFKLKQNENAHSIQVALHSFKTFAYWITKNYRKLIKQPSNGIFLIMSRRTGETLLLEKLQPVYLKLLE